MPIPLTCPTCQVRVTAPEAAVGRTLKCPACHGPVPVTAPAAPEPAPPPAPFVAQDLGSLPQAPAPFVAEDLGTFLPDTVGLLQPSGASSADEAPFDDFEIVEEPKSDPFEDFEIVEEPEPAFPNLEIGADEAEEVRAVEEDEDVPLVEEVEEVPTVEEVLDELEEVEERPVRYRRRGRWRPE
jgi:hypothetical protein